MWVKFDGTSEEMKFVVKNPTDFTMTFRVTIQELDTQLNYELSAHSLVMTLTLLFSSVLIYAL